GTTMTSRNDVIRGRQALLTILICAAIYTTTVYAQNPLEILIDPALHHLGNANFDETSANASELSKWVNEGDHFTTTFQIPKLIIEKAFLEIGRVKGVDHPNEVSINGKIVASIQNDYNLRVSIPVMWLRPDSSNEIVILTGKRWIPDQWIEGILVRPGYWDSDDFEFMGLKLRLEWGRREVEARLDAANRKGPEQLVSVCEDLLKRGTPGEYLRPYAVVTNCFKDGFHFRKLEQATAPGVVGFPFVLLGLKTRWPHSLPNVNVVYRVPRGTPNIQHVLITKDISGPLLALLKGTKGQMGATGMFNSDLGNQIALIDCLEKLYTSLGWPTFWP
ncbi:MAG: hypothetical protein ACREBU_20090, partial [Nitrososphaera sp.]